MKQRFKIGDLVYVASAGIPKRDAGPSWTRVEQDDITNLALILKIHTKAHPIDAFYKLHFMEKDMEEWVAETYLQPTY